MHLAPTAGALQIRDGWNSTHCCHGYRCRPGCIEEMRAEVCILAWLRRRLGLIGDLGQTENSAETLDHLTASDPGSVINVGDLSYADGYQPRSVACLGRYTCWDCTFNGLLNTG